jgi:hypothetical protein
MTAVVCALGTVKRIADSAGSLGAAIVDALATWVTSPVELQAASS